MSNIQGGVAGLSAGNQAAAKGKIGSDSDASDSLTRGKAFDDVFAGVGGSRAERGEPKSIKGLARDFSEEEGGDAEEGKLRPASGRAQSSKAAAARPAVTDDDIAASPSAAVSAASEFAETIGKRRTNSPANDADDNPPTPSSDDGEAQIDGKHPSTDSLEELLSKGAFHPGCCRDCAAG